MASQNEGQSLTDRPGGGTSGLLALMRTRGYARILALAALLGAPVSALAYGFVVLYQHLQTWLYQSLPSALGFAHPPNWWPFPLMLIGGVIVGFALKFLPGQGGHSPADGLAPGAPAPSALPGIFVASLATLGFGLVLGPEAPLIALGGGIAMFVSRKVLHKVPDTAHTIIGASGSLSALGTIFGSPLTATFFLMEGIGLGGEMLTLLVVPGLLAAGIGALVFVGLGAWTGTGISGLAIPHLPPFTRPDLPELGWCVLLGVGCALLAWSIRCLALFVRRFTRPRVLWATPLAGIVVAGMVVAFGYATGRSENAVLFSGQTYVGTLIGSAGTWAVGTLVLLVVFKALAYAFSLSSFRGGPVFPALFLGEAIGVAASHLPGFGLVPGVAAGMGAMTAAMLRLPVASVLLPVLLLAHDALPVTPLVIVSVVVAFMMVQYLPPAERVAGVVASVPGSQAGTPATPAQEAANPPARS